VTAGATTVPSRVPKKSGGRQRPSDDRSGLAQPEAMLRMAQKRQIPSRTAHNAIADLVIVPTAGNTTRLRLGMGYVNKKRTRNAEDANCGRSVEELISRGGVTRPGAHGPLSRRFGVQTVAGDRGLARGGITRLIRSPQGSAGVRAVPRFVATPGGASASSRPRSPAARRARAGRASAGPPTRHPWPAVNRPASRAPSVWAMVSIVQSPADWTTDSHLTTDSHVNHRLTTDSR